MPSITYPETAHTANVVREVAETAPLYEGLPNRLLTAFEVAECRCSAVFRAVPPRRSECQIRQYSLGNSSILALQPSSARASLSLSICDL